MRDKVDNIHRQLAELLAGCLLERLKGSWKEVDELGVCCHLLRVRSAVKSFVLANVANDVGTRGLFKTSACDVLWPQRPTWPARKYDKWEGATIL